MDIRKESLKKHYEWNGKIEVVTRCPLETREDMSLAYTPGVAEACLEIEKNVNKSFELTRRNNLVAVITDGTAVLGLGDIGPEAGMPVMEGKCALFKAFADVDAFPLCVKSKDTDEIVKTISYSASKSGLSGSSSITFMLWAPNGDVFSNQTGTLPLSALAYEGATDITNNATFQWYKYTSGKYQSISGATGRMYKVSGTDVVNIHTYKVVMK
jgi:hypothetical protein